MVRVGFTAKTATSRRWSLQITGSTAVCALGPLIKQLLKLFGFSARSSSISRLRFDVPFPPYIASPKRPVYTLTQKLVARCPDFSTDVYRRVLLPSAFPHAMLPMENSQMMCATSPVRSHLTTQAKKRLIATHANSEIAAIHSQQRTSHFLIAIRNLFPEPPQLLPLTGNEWTISATMECT
jgi:hypothetical protein